MMPSFRLDGRVVVVTGGAGLYGAHLCRTVAAAGASVVLTSRSLAKATKAAADLAGSGDVRPAELDQADPDSIGAFADRIERDFGRIDVLVNNAVHRQGRGLDGITADDWSATQDVNGRGLFLLTQRVARTMREHGGGSIVNIGSIYGITGPDLRLYAGTEMSMPAYYAYDKAGMIGLTRYLACVLGPDGIRVNCLAPGGLDDGTAPESFRSAYAQRTPLRRLASGADVAGALLLLASDAGGYITGVTLPVDGGFTAQ
ncbi:SDR family NAD(P)-dependent oxidoreductase [Kribbella sp.]|uniref:SDR family NAD(P)-dependent oxidoreductase n=1 Tax=Kribbella sp. TaxID=1871183 RepID=UPI002D67C67C|nr:SDR family oxidoreductase [Kribbella sp.]HZX07812.1 SDR family oxidoreductase [Kribbella sp.]